MNLLSPRSFSSRTIVVGDTTRAVSSTSFPPSTTAENSTVLRRDNLLAEVKDYRQVVNGREVVNSRQVVNLDVPVEDLKGGDYHVRLSGLPASGGAESVGRYDFRIVN